VWELALPDSSVPFKIDWPMFLKRSSRDITHSANETGHQLSVRFGSLEILTRYISMIHYLPQFIWVEIFTVKSCEKIQQTFIFILNVNNLKTQKMNIWASINLKKKLCHQKNVIDIFMIRRSNANRSCHQSLGSV